MKMSKHAVILLALGGVTLVSVGVLAFLVFGSIGERTTACEDLEDVRASVSRLNQSKIKPWAETLKLVEANTTLVDGWYRANYAKAGEGDCLFDAAISAPAFRQQIMSELAVLGEAKTRSGDEVVKAAFSPTFAKYISEGRMPEEENLAQLRRSWNDIRMLAELLVSNGVVEVVKVEATSSATAKAVQSRDGDADAQQEKQQLKKKNKKKKKAEPEVTGPVQIAESYQLEFLARPAGVVSVINALAGSKRFVTVKSFAFSRTPDMIAESLGERSGAGEGSQKQAQRGRGRGRLRSVRGVQEEEKPEAKKKVLVTDPDQEAPFRVTMSVEVNDFGSAVAAEAKPANEAGEGASESGDTEVAE